MESYIVYWNTRQRSLQKKMRSLVTPNDIMLQLYDFQYQLPCNPFFEEHYQSTCYSLYSRHDENVSNK